jgi:hypothetical protein
MPELAPPVVKLVFIVHLLSTLFMVGLIWFVQVVHYPLFAKVGADAFVPYENAHTFLTTFVVMPPMLLEIGTAFLLAFVGRPEGVSPLLAWVGLALILVIWGSTFLLQVPQHEILSSGFAEGPHRFLVLSNWVRTAAWSARAVILGVMVWQVMGNSAR